MWSYVAEYTCALNVWYQYGKYGAYNEKYIQINVYKLLLPDLSPSIGKMMGRWIT